MEPLTIFLLSCLTFFVGVTALLGWLLLRQTRATERELASQRTTHLEQISSLLKTQAESTSLLSQQETTRQSQLLHLAEKGMALAASADPLAFQAIQAMEPTPSGYDADYDPSDEGEVERIMARSPRLQEDDLNGYERDALLDLGVDPAFFDGGAGGSAD